MEFGLCQPDPDFGRMYSGPASSPMVAAAQAGAALADELYSAADGYQSVVSELASGD
ncbi:PPE domain-containing protein [Mycobacterium sp. 1245111.1]|uniref:PPE domain-containing protein n=1 Tax=Mycobacterium sp. 1245111.1 TaxID=1834073 RepID=UPI0009F26C10